MLDPHSPLGEKLASRRVRVRADGEDTLVLQNVPANTRYFNKTGTNLMVKRARSGRPFLIAVDADLAYSGPDPALTRAFAAGTTQQGWRIVLLDSRGENMWTDVVEDALRVVGFDDVEPRWAPHEGERPAQTGAGVLAKFGVDVSALPAVATVGRDEAVDEVRSVLGLAQARMAVVLGESGAGKSHLLRAVAQRLAPDRMIAVNLSDLFTGTAFDAERENLLQAVIAEAGSTPRTVRALEGLELVFEATRHGPGALARAIDGGARVVATALPALLAQLAQPPLARRLHPLSLQPLSADQTAAAVRLALPGLARHHGVSIDDAVVDAIVEQSRPAAGQQPAKAIALADGACARARVAGSPALELVHVYLAAGSLDAGESD